MPCFVPPRSIIGEFGAKLAKLPGSVCMCPFSSVQSFKNWKCRARFHTEKCGRSKTINVNKNVRSVQHRVPDPPATITGKLGSSKAMLSAFQNWTILSACCSLMFTVFTSWTLHVSYKAICYLASSVCVCASWGLGLAPSLRWGTLPLWSLQKKLCWNCLSCAICNRNPICKWWR